MKGIFRGIALTLALLAPAYAHAQTSPQAAATTTEAKEAAAEQAFKAGNELMDQKKYAEALGKYKEALNYLPDDTSILYNSGVAAYLSKDFAEAVNAWKRLKELSPDDWQVRAKLIQAYQALDNLQARDAERTALFEMRKKGNNQELSQQDFYCREQFEVAGKKLMVFEHFELKGERALRYVFTVLNQAGDDEEYRISLGSYEMDNAIWREMTKPKPKAGERLFHLDGYFKSGHATYGMYTVEPSYDEIRKIVINILSDKQKPVSSTTVISQPKEASPTKKP